MNHFKHILLIELCIALYFILNLTIIHSSIAISSIFSVDRLIDRLSCLLFLLFLLLLSMSTRFRWVCHVGGKAIEYSVYYVGIYLWNGRIQSSSNVAMACVGATERITWPEWVHNLIITRHRYALSNGLQAWRTLLSVHHCPHPVDSLIYYHGPHSIVWLFYVCVCSMLVPVSFDTLIEWTWHSRKQALDPIVREVPLSISCSTDCLLISCLLTHLRAALSASPPSIHPILRPLYRVHIPPVTFASGPSTTDRTQSQPFWVDITCTQVQWVFGFEYFIYQFNCHESYVIVFEISPRIGQ